MLCNIAKRVSIQVRRFVAVAEKAVVVFTCGKHSAALHCTAH